MYRRAEMGVGTLIIFIALLLVAAVAAGVLIQTASSLQQKALSTGKQATTQVSTHMEALSVIGMDGRTNITNLSMIIKLAPGSDPVNLDEISMTFNTVNTSQYFDYASSSNGSTSEFNATYLQTGVNNQTGVLVRGDVLEIHFQASRPLVAGETIRINLIPKIGSATQVIAPLPDVINVQQVHLYP